ncbi:hypothetical protein T10_1728 [Trichinella papuae]|uniref:Uncharacterized protein n=1 Tax=Trichinella papuae TaxID=268474 RepID=A0A0V1N4K9_9BILA|nr:hypothetical protein T10_1728 [Trichinella papuae]
MIIKFTSIIEYAVENISCNADSRIFVVLSQHSSQRGKIISKIEQVFCLSWKLDNKYSALGNAIATNVEK